MPTSLEVQCLQSKLRHGNFLSEVGQLCSFQLQSGMFSVLRLCFVNFGKINFSGESPQRSLHLQVREGARLAGEGWEPSM